MKTTRLVELAVLLTCFCGATATKADIIQDYAWQQASTTQSGYTSTGTLTFDSTLDVVVSIDFTENNSGISYSGNVMNFTGTATVLPPGLPNGDLQLSGTSLGSQITGTGPATSFLLGWLPNGSVSSSTEQEVTDNTTIYGAWVPVPEPTTVIAGALLLLPFVASTTRILKRRIA